MNVLKEFEALLDARRDQGGTITRINENDALLRLADKIRAEAVPLAPYMALMVLLNHVEPGWANCREVVKQWYDALPKPYAGSEPQDGSAT